MIRQNTICILLYISFYKPKYKFGGMEIGL